MGTQAFWVLAIVLCIACAPEVRAPALEVAETDSAGVTIVMITGEVADLPEWRLTEQPVTTIRGSEAPYLARVGEVEMLSDGRVVVEDNQSDEIHLFAADGGYVGLLGDRGDGPGQYQQVTEMTYGPGDSIYLYDRRHDRLSVVHPDTGFVRSVSLLGSTGTRPPLDVHSIGPDRLVVYRTIFAGMSAPGPLPRPDQREVQLTLTDGAGQELAESVFFPGSFSVVFELGDAGAPFSNNPVLAGGGGRFVHGTGRTYDLSVRDTDFNHLREIRWPGWTQPVSEEEIEAVRGEIRRVYAEAGPNRARALEEAMLAPNLIPDQRPALGRVLMDDLGRTWVSGFTPMFLEPSTDWHVLNEFGHPIARITLPEGSFLLAVRGPRLLLLVHDEFDVQDIEVWAFVTGGV
jgi:hypothetical protein